MSVGGEKEGRDDEQGGDEDEGGRDGCGGCMREAGELVCGCHLGCSVGPVVKLTVHPLVLLACSCASPQG